MRAAVRGNKPPLAAQGRPVSEAAVVPEVLHTEVGVNPVLDLQVRPHTHPAPSTMPGLEIVSACESAWRLDR